MGNTCGKWSVTDTFTTLNTCNVASALNQTGSTCTSVTVSWTATADSFKVYWRKTGGYAWSNGNSGTNSKTISGLIPGTGYDWRVQSYCNGNLSTYSATSTASTSPVPTGLNETGVTCSQATLNWVSDGGASYSVRYRAMGAPVWIWGGVSAVSKTITGLSASTTYQ